MFEEELDSDFDDLFPDDEPFARNSGAPPSNSRSPNHDEDSSDDESLVGALLKRTVPAAISATATAVDKNNEEIRKRHILLLDDQLTKKPRLSPPVSTPTPKLPERPKARFPGPAGMIHNKGNKFEESSSQFPSSQSQAPTQLSRAELTDKNLSWQHFLRTEDVAISDATGSSLIDVYNIEWAKKKTIQVGMTFKMPILVAAIRSIDLTSGLDPKCEMVDRNHSIACMIHRDVFERHGASLILPGTVILLKNVTIVKHSNGKLSGIVTPNNLVSIYVTKESTVNVENFCRLSKDDVRRTAAKLNRDEKAKSRMLMSVQQATNINVDQPLQHFPSISSLPSNSMQTFSPAVTSTPMMSNGLNVAPLGPQISRQNQAPIHQNPPPRTGPLSTSLGRSPTSSTLSLGSSLGSRSSTESLPPPALGPSLKTGLVTDKFSDSRSNNPTDRSARSGVSLTGVPWPASTGSLSNKLERFRAPVPSPPASAALKVAEKNSNPVEATKPRFTFKPAFKVPNKSSGVNDNASQTPMTQEGSGDVENLFDGLDEDSIFGDF